ncbi:MAG: aminotransferase class V-fold PLP-dependent enzyme [Bacteroidota bacterium]
MSSLSCQKSKFLLPEDIHYLNGAYMSPNLKSVEEAGLAGMRAKRNPIAVTPEDFFTDSNHLRERFVQLVNASHPQSIAIIPAVSYGIATAAKNIPLEAGDEIIIAGDQFPSNVYTWRNLAQERNCTLTTIDRPDQTTDVGQTWNERIRTAITPNTKVVAISHCHWTDGTLFDLEAISNRIHDVDGYLVVDGTQSVGALPFDVQQIQPDALICAGYKWLMGSYGLGVAYFGSRLQEGTPLEENWILREDSEDFSQLINYRDAYQPGAIRYDVGERSNFILVPMLNAAIQQLLDWQPARIQQYTRELMAPYLQRWQEVGCRLEEPNHRAHHLFGIYLPQHIEPKALQRQLKESNVHVSVRGSSVRVSPNVYNDSADAEALTEIIERALS